MQTKKQSLLFYLRRRAQIDKFVFKFWFFLIAIIRLDFATFRQKNQRFDRLREKNSWWNEWKKKLRNFQISRRAFMSRRLRLNSKVRFQKTFHWRFFDVLKWTFLMFLRNRSKVVKCDASCVSSFENETFEIEWKKQIFI